MSSASRRKRWTETQEEAMKISRRNLLAAGGSTAITAMIGAAPWSSAQSQGQQTEASPDLIVHNARVTTLQNGPPEAQAFAVRGESIVAVGGDEIRRIESVLTVTGGDVVYSAGPFTMFAPEPVPPTSPAWSPVAAFGGYQR
jgi:hypothetical protein